MSLRGASACKWVGAALTLLVVTCWLISGWSTIIWDQPAHGIESLRLQRGRLRAVLAEERREGNTLIDGVRIPRPSPPLFEWEFEDRPVGRARVVSVPLWTLCAASLVPAAWLFYRDRRRVRWAGRCVGCGYDLSGLPPGAACPECGKGGPT